jgi:hypothetical protein
MKPVIKIVWNHASDPQKRQIAEQINGQFQRMPRVLDEVKNTEAWTLDGRVVRLRLRQARIVCLY